MEQFEEGSQNRHLLLSFFLIFHKIPLVFYAPLLPPQKKIGWSQLLLTYFWDHGLFWFCIFCRIILVPLDTLPACLLCRIILVLPDITPAYSASSILILQILILAYFLCTLFVQLRSIHLFFCSCLLLINLSSITKCY